MGVLVDEHCVLSEHMTSSITAIQAPLVYDQLEHILIGDPVNSHLLQNERNFDIVTERLAIVVATFCTTGGLSYPTSSVIFVLIVAHLWVLQLI